MLDPFGMSSFSMLPSLRRSKFITIDEVESDGPSKAVEGIVVPSRQFEAGAPHY